MQAGPERFPEGDWRGEAKISLPAQRRGKAVAPATQVLGPQERRTDYPELCRAWYRRPNSSLSMAKNSGDSSRRRCSGVSQRQGLAQVPGAVSPRQPRRGAFPGPRSHQVGPDWSRRGSGASRRLRPRGRGSSWIRMRPTGGFDMAGAGAWDAGGGNVDEGRLPVSRSSGLVPARAARS